jgi:hypothetical protein
MSVNQYDRPPAVDSALPAQPLRSVAQPLQTEERTLGDLFVGLTDDMSTLMRQEIKLAKAETMQTISKAGRGAAMMAGGGFVAYAGLILLLIAAAIGMGSVIPLWLSTLIVGIIALVVGFILLQSGRSTISNLTIVPEKTVESIKEDAEWVKEQVR